MKNLISIVVPSYNEAENVFVLVEAIEKTLKDRHFEIIFVNDGSSDDTLNSLQVLSEKYTFVRYISFSRNFGHQAALRAGLRYAKGEAIISMDADMQHPPALLPELIKHWEQGYQVVYTVRKDTNKTSFRKRATSSLFYKILNFLSDLDMEEGAADFRLLDRKVVEVINSQQETDIFLRGYIHWIGFRQKSIDYIPAERFSGTSKYTLKKMLGLAGKGVTQFSVKPLRLSFGLAFLAFALSLVYVLYAVIVALSGGAIHGWLSLVTLFVFLQGVQFLLLGLVGEYLGRTFMQTKHRPEYIVADASDDQ